MIEPCRVLLGLTGSVATIKVQELVQQLHQSAASQQPPLPIEIQVIATTRALHFFQPSALQATCPIYTDEDEWKSWSQRGDPVLHIELRKWADILLIAPLDANTLAKLAHGQSWDLEKPWLVCPAMNTCMWTHPLTAEHVHVLETKLKCHIIGPIAKQLMCGDTGLGAMETPLAIAERTIHHLQMKRVQEGRKS